MRRYLFIAMLVSGMAIGCSDVQEPVQPAPNGPGQPPPVGPAPAPAATLFLVSTPSAALSGISVAASLSSASTVVYVSLPPESMPQGTSAIIANRRRGGSVTVPIIEGGFDPVPLSAALGDTLIVTAETGGGHPVVQSLMVKAAPPTIVRTSPRKNKRDVPLNIRITVVFSAPIKSTTLNSSSVRLTTAGTAVNGVVRAADGTGTVAEFVPDAPLAAESAYELAISQDIRGIDGRALAAAATVPFTTVGADAPVAVRWPWFVSRAVPYESGNWAFVSAPPGALPPQTYISVNRPFSSGPANNSASRVGALDPVPVLAGPGDTIEVTINPFDGSSPTVYAAVVPTKSVPFVVRSTPASGEVAARTDVDLLVVFSEPIALGDIDDIPLSTARLETAGSVVPGHWSVAGWVPPQAPGQVSLLAPYRAIFTPSTPLTPGASYEIRLTAALTGDRGGSAMLAQSIPFTALNPPPGPLDAVLTVQSFGMIEYRYPGDTLYYYAPQLQLAETGGRADATVMRMNFTLPAYPPLATVCSPGTPVPAGQSAGMFGIIYGDYEWSYFTMDGSRAGAGQAAASIIYHDAAGRTDTLTAEGPITPGTPPSVYVSGEVHPYFNGSAGCQNPWYLRSGKGATASVRRIK